MPRKKRRSRTAKAIRIRRAILPAVLGLLLIAALWFALSALFSVSPPIHYVTSCSMYPAYSRADLLFVLPLPPSAPIFGYDGLLSQPQPWVVSYGNQSASLNASISAYCNNSVEQMCRQFYSDPAGFSETNGPVTYVYARCTLGGSNPGPCVSTAEVGDTSFPTAQKPHARAYEARVLPAGQEIQIIHRAFFGIRDASGSVFFFTKGDANPVFDSQAEGFFLLNAASAANASSVKGVVVAKIPFAGELMRYLRGTQGC
jgi:hypothetical protein